MKYLQSIINNEKLIFLVFPFLCLSWRLFIPNEFLGNGVFFQDDFYYYLKLGENFWKYGFFTFDGINTTNGFQPLWQLIIIIISLFFEGDSLVKASLLLNLLLTILFFYFFLKLIKKLKLPIFPLVLSIIALISFPSLGQYLFNGMETALAAFLIVLSFLYFIKLNEKEISYKDSIYFGILTGLSMLARLDSFVIFIYPYFILLLKKRDSFFISSIAHLSIVIPYLSWLYINFGSIFPISGAVKNFYSTFYHLNPNPSLIDFINYTNDAFFNSIPYLKYSVFFAPTYVLRIFDFNLNYFIFLSISSILVCLIPFYFLKINTVNNFGIYKILGVSFLIYFFYVFYYYNFELIGLDNWTYGILGFLLLYLGFYIFNFFNLNKYFINFTLGLNPIILFILFFVTQSFPYLIHEKSLKNHISFGGENNNLYVKAADWANQNLPEEAITGGWPAGQLGFRMKNKLVQLEGLVNSNSFLKVLENEEFLDHACNQKIEYYFLSVGIKSPDTLSFKPEDIFREKSQIKTYRGKYLSELWPYLSLEWAADENFSKENSYYSTFFIWKFDRNVCETI